MAGKRYDVVWYWSGDRRDGVWFAIYDLVGLGSREVAEGLRRANFVAIEGTQSVGPPEGPPTEEAFRRLEECNSSQK